MRLIYHVHFNDLIPSPHLPLKRDDKTNEVNNVGGDVSLTQTKSKGYDQKGNNGGSKKEYSICFTLPLKILEQDFYLPIFSGSITMAASDILPL
jgi:hypothetical protein